MTEYEKIVAMWQKKQITTDAELAEALNGHSIAFAYNSCKLENDNVTYNDTREIFERGGVASYTGDICTLFEISNAKEANEFLLTAFGEKRPLDEEFIKEAQRILTQKTYDARRWQLGERPGEYKHRDYVTGKNGIGASPDEVHEEMAELIAEMTDIPNGKALTAAAYFHVKFENIHPFADGNGRTGRLLMNYILLLHDHPPVIIHEEDRKEYYGALEAWDERQELTLIFDFLKAQTVKTWEKQLVRAERREKS